MAERLTGAVLVLLGGAAAGLVQNRAQAGRVRLLEELDAALGIMISEISTLQTPLPELFSRLSREGPPLLRGFFAENAVLAARGTLSDEWKDAVGRLAAGTEAESALLRLGLSLGRYDAVSQASALEMARVQISGAADRERVRLERQGRLLPGLGACLGAMAAILLI